MENTTATYKKIKINGLTFFVDPKKPSLQPGEQAVYPFTDEAMTLFGLASKVYETRKKPFKVAMDPFSGDGKSGLPLVHHGIAKKIVGIDINPRAINLATQNAKANGLTESSSFEVGDVTIGLPKSHVPGDTLYIANPPFALKAKGANMETMRDGGESGLTLTMAYVTHAIEDAKQGDVILGIGYSRIRTDSIELKEDLKKLIKRYGGKLTFDLIKGQTLWRGFNGEKEQPNPMPISPKTFALKANPSNAEEIAAYETAARAHNEDGYDKLGYFSYIIKK